MAKIRKILIVGKDNVMKWPQAVYRFLPCEEKELFLYNRFSFIGTALKLFGKKKRFAYLARLLKKRIASFKPDAVVFVGAFLLPVELFEALKDFDGIVKSAWAGDSWAHKNQKDIQKALNVLDVLFITSSDFEQEATGFKGKIVYLPLCANTDVFKKSDVKRTEKPFFVGVANEDRQKLFEACETPCLIYGKGWDVQRLKQHEVHNQTLSIQEAQRFVSASVAPININLTPNGKNGLNFRTFEISACGGLIMTNYREDLPRCYQVGTEAVVYKTPEEFSALVQDIVAFPDKYAQIAEAGYERTMKEHTYTARLKQMIDVLEGML